MARALSCRSELVPEAPCSPTPVGADGQPILIANPGADLYGSDRMALETVSALVRRGERVIVTVPETGPLIGELKCRGAAVVITPTPILRKSALRPKGMVHLLQTTLGSLVPGVTLLKRLRPKLVVVNTITAPLWLPLARAVRVPAICHVHEGEASSSPVLQKAVTMPLLVAQRLIVNSQFSRNVLTSALPALDRRASVVYNAVPGPSEIVKPRPGLTDPVRLLYVGRLSPRKGPDVAVRAVELLSQRGVDATLDLVGAVFPGYEWFEQQIRDQVAAAGISERVRFHGFQHDVWPYLAASDITLIPSTADEGFGNTAVEAALAARPAVVSRSSGLIEASSGLGSAIQVTPGSAEEIADAVQAIATDWPTYASAAVGDAQKASERYSQDNYQKSINEILAGVTA